MSSTFDKKISPLLQEFVPEFLKSDHPKFVKFLKDYYQFLEAGRITLSTTINYVTLENTTVSYVLNETDETRIVTEIGEGTLGQFIEGETITGRKSKQTGTVSGYKENTIIANNKILDYSDIDRTSEDFLQHFQTDFLPSLDLKQTQNKRLTIKGISDLYKEKGTAESLKFLMRILYNEDAEIRYPDNETIYNSESDYSQKRRVNILMTDLRVAPSATDKIIQYDSNNNVIANSIVEKVKN